MKNKVNAFRIAAIAAILILTSMVTVTVAQTPELQDLKKSTPEQRAEWQNKLMKEKLKLTEAQYRQVNQLNLDYARKMQPLITGDGSRLSRGKKARALMKEKEDKLKLLLTKEQFGLYRQDIEKKMDEAKEAFMKRKNP